MVVRVLTRTHRYVCGVDRQVDLTFYSSGAQNPSLLREYLDPRPRRHLRFGEEAPNIGRISAHSLLVWSKNGGTTLPSVLWKNRSGPCSHLPTLPEAQEHSPTQATLLLSSDRQESNELF